MQIENQTQTQIIPRVEEVFEVSEGLSSPNWETRELPQSNFDEAIEQAQIMYDLRVDPEPVSPKGRGLHEGDDADYDVVDLSSLLFTDTGTVFVPGFGSAQLSIDAKKTIKQITGIDTNKVFEHMPPHVIQKMWDMYFSNLPLDQTNRKRVVARRPIKGEEVGNSDCVIKGFTSERYIDIPDVQLLELIKSETSMDNSYRVEARFNNSYTCLSIIDPNSKDMAKVGENISIGMRVFNSDIGHSAIKAVTYLWRLICGNGMGTSVNGELLFKQNHKKVDLSLLRKLIDYAWNEALSNVVNTFEERAEKLHNISFLPAETEEKIYDWLRGDLPRKRIEVVQKAFEAEPMYTAYGVLQAITRAGSAVRNSLRQSHEFEDTAERFIRKMTKN